jgi:ABC-type transport system involved in multi-copper enzyme maturation permease subunit
MISTGLDRKQRHLSTFRHVVTALVIAAAVVLTVEMLLVTSSLGNAIDPVSTARQWLFFAVALGVAVVQIPVIWSSLFARHLWTAVVVEGALFTAFGIAASQAVSGGQTCSQSGTGPTICQTYSNGILHNYWLTIFLGLGLATGLLSWLLSSDGQQGDDQIPVAEVSTPERFI